MTAEVAVCVCALVGLGLVIALNLRAALKEV